MIRKNKNLLRHQLNVMLTSKVKQMQQAFEENLIKPTSLVIYGSFEASPL